MAVISFARGVPAPECLPVEELAECARAALDRDGATILNYGPVGGYAPLREWLSEQIYRHGGRYAPSDLLRRVTGSGIDPEPYLKYLHTKFA